MTMNKRVTIEPHDILAIEYECRQCKARYSVPLDKLSRAQMVCPGCNATWIRGEYGGPDRIDYKIVQFANLLRDLRGIGVDAIIRLEIVAPQESQDDSKIKS